MQAILYYLYRYIYIYKIFDIYVPDSKTFHIARIPGTISHHQQNRCQLDEHFMVCFIIMIMISVLFINYRIIVNYPCPVPFSGKEKACKEAMKVEKKKAKEAAKDSKGSKAAPKAKAKAAPKGKAKAKSTSDRKKQTPSVSGKKQKADSVDSPNVKRTRRGRPAKVNAGVVGPPNLGGDDRGWAVSPMAVKSSPKKKKLDERMDKAKAGLQELMDSMSKSDDGQFTDPPAGFCKKFLA